MQQLVLPSSIATKAQLLSMRKNIEEVLEAMTQNAVRRNENVDVQPAPPVSGGLAALLAVNKLQPDTKTVTEVSRWIEYLLHHAPVVRLTFASEPGPKELQRIIDWFRQESGMIVLLHIGIQPTIAAGVIARTTSHRYDMSLKSQLEHKSQSFIEAVVKVSEKVAAQQAPAPASAAPPGGAA